MHNLIIMQFNILFMHIIRINMVSGCIQFSVCNLKFRSGLTFIIFMQIIFHAEFSRTLMSYLLADIYMSSSCV